MKVYFEPCTEKQQKMIYDEFGATAESLKNDVNTLMEWMDKQSHLPNVKDEKWLTHFLLCCKNSLERAKHRLDNYYTVRALNPEFLTGRVELIPRISSFSKLMSFIPMPKLTNDGKRVMILRMFPDGDFPITSEILIKSAQMIHDIIMKKDFASQFIMVYDMENMTLPIMTAAFPAMKQLVAQITTINPYRLYKLYILNTSSLVDPLIKFSLSLLSKKLTKRTVLWKKKSQDLAEVIDGKIIPPLYGGTEKPLEELRELWVEYSVSLKNWLIAEESVKADLNKKTIENESSPYVGEYGIEGTFRKINLD